MDASVLVSLGEALAPTFARFDKRCEKLEGRFEELSERTFSLREGGSQPSYSASRSRKTSTSLALAGSAAAAAKRQHTRKDPSCRAAPSNQGLGAGLSSGSGIEDVQGGASCAGGEDDGGDGEDDGENGDGGNGAEDGDGDDGGDDGGGGDGDGPGFPPGSQENSRSPGADDGGPAAETLKMTTRATAGAALLKAKKKTDVEVPNLPYSRPRGFIRSPFASSRTTLSSSPFALKLQPPSPIATPITAPYFSGSSISKGRRKEAEFLYRIAAFQIQRVNGLAEIFYNGLLVGIAKAAVENEWRYSYALYELVATRYEILLDLSGSPQEQASGRILETLATPGSALSALGRQRHRAFSGAHLRQQTKKTTFRANGGTPGDAGGGGSSGVRRRV